MLDTGAAMNVIDSAGADRLKLSRAMIRGREATASGNGVTGAAAGSVWELDDIAIGPARLGRTFALAFDLKPVAASLGHEVPGLIGTQLLREFPFTLDYTADTLTLYDPAHFPPPELEHVASLPLRLVGNIPVVPGVVEGSTGGWFCIDSGDNGEVALYYPFLRRHPELGLLNGRRAAGPTNSTGLSGAITSWNAWLWRFEALGKTRLNVQVTYVRQPIEGAVSGDVYAGRIGGALLDGARLTMDYANGRAWCEWPARRNSGSANESPCAGAYAVVPSGGGGQRATRARLARPSRQPEYRRQRRPDAVVLRLRGGQLRAGFAAAQARGVGGRGGGLCGAARRHPRAAETGRGSPRPWPEQHRPIRPPAAALGGSERPAGDNRGGARGGGRPGEDQWRGRDGSVSGRRLRAAPRRFRSCWRLGNRCWTSRRRTARHRSWRRRRAVTPRSSNCC